MAIAAIDIRAMASAIHKGRFITLEGCEGVGKSTQLDLLAEALKKRGIKLIETCQPGGTEAGKALRKLLVTGEVGRWSPITETALLLADRAIHLDELIRPALARGEWVLCDRFMDSTLAYQGGAGGLGFALIDQLQAPIIGDTVPDLTLWLDLPEKTGLTRAHKRDKARADETQATTNRFENKTAAYHAKVRESFQTLTEANPQRIKRIDASQEINLVAAQILAIVESHFFTHDKPT